MKKSILIIIIGFLFFAGCGNDKKVPVGNDKNVPVENTKKVPVENDNISGLSTSIKEGESEKSEEVKSEMGENINSLLNPCDLITTDELSKVFGFGSDKIKVKNTNNSGKYSNSCFLSWENVEEGSKSRMFLMLQTNPLPGEFEDWAKSFIDAKISSGDMGYPDKGEPYKYKTISKFGIDAAYSEELKRVYWKANKEYVLAIFYNAGFSSKNRKRYAAKIAKIMNANLNSKL